MTQVQRQAVLLSLIRHLRERGSWCGETHIQKAVYFLQGACGIQLGFGFILYKHGPYSFDLNDELTALRADRLLTVVPEEKYGSHLHPTLGADEFLKRFPKTVGATSSAVEAVAQHLGNKTVTELERLATALYVVLERPNGRLEEHISSICHLKPHVTHADALAALQSLRGFQASLAVA